MLLVVSCGKGYVEMERETYKAHVKRMVCSSQLRMTLFNLL